ncbi:MAG: class I SAM-dependent methyltransferase [Candidatus Hydrogenedentes bacterium]|nr:class I SAM-dependent methyltransferase [Candidatus Hydrogenedentota bacterium]
MAECNGQPELQLIEGVLPEGAAVLDIGCGNGRLSTRRLAARYRTVGLDMSQARLDEARQNVPSAVFVRGDVFEHGFPSNFFDGVVSFHLLYLLPVARHRPFFERVHQWLKPGGYFLATVAVRDEKYHENLLSFQDYEGLMNDAGFTLLEPSGPAHGLRDGYFPAEAYPVLFAQKKGP